MKNEKKAVELERLQHKAEQYDDVVLALRVCDGGRYRNDTIESVIAAAKGQGTLSAELRAAVDLLRKVNTPGDLYEVLDDVQDFVAAYDAQHPEGK